MVYYIKGDLQKRAVALTRDLSDDCKEAAGSACSIALFVDLRNATQEQKCK